MRVPALEDRQPEPVTGHTLHVVVGGGWRLPVRSVAAPDIDGDLELLPLTGDASMPAGVDVLPASLEWRSPTGLVRRQGTLRLGRRGFVLGEAREAVVMQRRNFARVRCAVRVAVVGSAPDAEIITQTVDLSVGGMLVEHAALLDIHERVRFTINLPDDSVIHGVGDIVRATPFGHRAVQFEPFDRRDEQRLARFVFAQEREGRSTSAYSA